MKKYLACMAIACILGACNSKQAREIESSEETADQIEAAIIQGAGMPGASSTAHSTIRWLSMPLSLMPMRISRPTNSTRSLAVRLPMTRPSYQRYVPPARIWHVCSSRIDGILRIIATIRVSGSADLMECVFPDDCRSWALDRPHDRQDSAKAPERFLKA